MMNRMPPITPERIWTIGWGFARSMILETGINHHVFDHIEGGAHTAEEVAARAKTSLRGTRILLNALTGMELLTKDAEGRYGLAPDTAMFLVRSKRSYIGGMLSTLSTQSYPRWASLSEAVTLGKPVHSVNQEQDGQEFFESFVEHLFPLNFPAASALAQALLPDAVNNPVKVLDLAAGSGVWGIAMAQRSPQVHVLAVDWPRVLEVTKRFVGRMGLTGQFAYSAGDLSAADFGSSHHIATLGHILHSEGETKSRALVRKTFDALAPGGTIAVQEFLVDDERAKAMQGLVFAVNMLVNTDEGDTWSFNEIGGWLNDAGFENVRVLEAPGPSPIILATRPK
jgi:hypothetical protein